jgi:hypothetical protein
MITGLGGEGSEVRVAMLRDLAVGFAGYVLSSSVEWGVFFRLRGGIYLHSDCTCIMHNQVLAWQNVGSAKNLRRGKPA